MTASPTSSSFYADTTSTQLLAHNNLSDLVSVATALANLGLGVPNGTGNVVLDTGATINGPTLVTPNIGQASGTLLALTGYTRTGAAFASPITTNYSVTDADSFLLFNGSGSITVTLPDPTLYTGRMIWLKNLAAQTVVSASSNVCPLASATPGTALIASGAGKAVFLVSDGTNWQTMAAM